MYRVKVKKKSSLDRFSKEDFLCYKKYLIFLYNLIALVVAEDQETLKNISVEKCSLRSGEGIRRSEFIPIGNILYSPFLSIRKSLTHKERIKAPCNVDCQTCKRFKDKCAGCPAVKGYKGIL